MDGLDGRIALVTGASRGLGYALAKSLSLAGAHVIALARTSGALEDLDEEIRGAGGSATLVPADLCDDPALELLGAAIHERWGQLDIWAHTAIHGGPLAPAEHADAGDLDGAIAVNLRATQRLIRVLDPLLRRSTGAAAVFCRDFDAEDRKFNAVYAATKAAQLTIARTWQRETAHAGLKVVIATTPAMPTALRARFFPGEDRNALTSCEIVADRLVGALAQGASGEIDLTTQIT